MFRRVFLSLFALPVCTWAAARDAVRGRLQQLSGAPPRIKFTDGSEVELAGDADTLKVLRDARLANDDFEALGTRDGARFQVDPIFERAMFVYRNGRRLVVTYWCEICTIRSFAPGKCVCCQEETEFDPRDPALKDSDPTPPNQRQ